MRRTRSNIDDSLLSCPITLSIFHDPVIAADDHTYEREFITEWINQHHTSPMTGQPLPDDLLRPNYIIRQLVAEYKSEPPTDETPLLPTDQTPLPPTDQTPFPPNQPDLGRLYDIVRAYRYYLWVFLFITILILPAPKKS
jgi:hypothetical protein